MTAIMSKSEFCSLDIFTLHLSFGHKVIFNFHNHFGTDLQATFSI